MRGGDRSTPNHWQGRSVARGVALLVLSVAIFGILTGSFAFGLTKVSAGVALSVLSMMAVLPLIAALAIHSARLMLRFWLRPLPEGVWLQPIEHVPALVVPVIIRNDQDIEAIRASADENLPFIVQLPMVFLVDFPDADSEVGSQDRLLMDLLRTRMSDHLSAGNMLLLTRRRLFDPIDCIWRGWERKRGKIEEFCKFLLGEETSFQQPLPDTLKGASAFVTIDIDTRLMPDTIALLMEAADREAGIATPMLEDRCRLGASWFESMVELASRRHASDPQLNFNQSRLGYDLYYGKGLILADRFLARTRRRIPERTILSHDHLESMLVGAVASSRALVCEEIPRSREQWARRQYRWTRGDFQILPWIFRGSLPMISRLHLLEVVLGHLAVPCSVLLTAIALATIPWPVGSYISLFFLALIRPTLLLLPLWLPLIILGSGDSLVVRWRRAASIAASEIAAWVLNLVYAPGNIFIVIRAALVTGWRLCWSRRNLLQWEESSPRVRAAIYGNAVAIGRILLGAIAFGMALRASHAIQMIGLLLSLWFLAPVLLSARWQFQPKSNGKTDGPARSVIPLPPKAG